jgi:transposase
MRTHPIYRNIESAKANGLEPYSYLRHIFEKLSLVQTEQDLKELLPPNIHPDDIAVTAQS